MQCERLIKQIKSWYIHVSNETMAPARMVSFIEEHALDCPVCRKDPELKGEIEKITEMILPESKIPKAVRIQQEQEKEKIALEAEAAAREAGDKDKVTGESNDTVDEEI